jgi:hypothetical protein
MGKNGEKTTKTKNRWPRMGGIGTKNIKNVLFFEDTLRLLQNRWKLDVYFFLLFTGQTSKITKRAGYAPDFEGEK